MKEKNKLINILLALGVINPFIIFLIATGFAGNEAALVFKFLPFFIFTSGITFLFAYIKFSKTFFKLFTGLFFILCGLFVFIIETKLLPFSIRESWPVVSIIAGLSLFISGRIKYKHFAIKFDFPAAVLFIYGLIFSLFSFNIIKISFKTSVLILGPIFIALSAFFLSILVLKRKQILKMLPENISQDFINNPAAEASLTSNDEEDYL